MPIAEFALYRNIAKGGAEACAQKLYIFGIFQPERIRIRDDCRHG
jgi:hypothetical protein